MVFGKFIRGLSGEDQLWGLHFTRVYAGGPGKVCHYSHLEFIRHNLYLRSLSLFILTVVIAAASWELFEKPINRLNASLPDSAAGLKPIVTGVRFSMLV